MKSDVFDKMNWIFFQTVAISVLLYGCTNSMKRLQKKAYIYIYIYIYVCVCVFPGLCLHFTSHLNPLPVRIELTSQKNSP